MASYDDSDHAFPDSPEDSLISVCHFFVDGSGVDCVQSACMDGTMGLTQVSATRREASRLSPAR